MEVEEGRVRMAVQKVSPQWWVGTMGAGFWFGAVSSRAVATTFDAATAPIRCSSCCSLSLLLLLLFFLLTFGIIVSSFSLPFFCFGGGGAGGE